jgi:PAS domain S-box-containing protein
VENSQGKSTNRRKSKGGSLASPPAADESVATTSLKILVVDDDSVDRLNVCTALRSCKFKAEIEEVESLAAAMEKLRAGPFSVVILDHLLPDGKSVDFLRELRSRGLRVPIVVTTGYGDEALVVELLKTGAGDYLSKDRITPESMFRAVSHAIRIFREHEESLRKDALLEASAQAAALLHARSDRLSVLGGALSLLGRALDADRLAVFEILPHPRTHAPAVCHRCEWIGSADEIRLNDPAQQSVPFDQLGLARWHAVLLSGHVVAGMPGALPEGERALFTNRGIRSFMAVPIMISGRCWGFVQIEAHNKDRVWSEQEKHILFTLSSAIGGTLLHRRDDDALRQSDALHREIVNLQTELISRFTQDYRLTFVNEAYCAYCNRTRDQLIGADFRSFIPEAQHSAVAEHLAGLTPENPVGTHENDVSNADGSVKWIQWTNRAFFDELGVVREYQSVGRDITALRKAEKEVSSSRDFLNSIIDAIPDPIFVKDHLHRMVLVNEAECRLTGHPREEVLGKTDELFFPKEQVEVFMAKDREVMESGRENVNEEQITSADGDTRTIVTKKSLYRTPAGEPMVVGVIRDISDMKKVELALREREEQYRTLLDNLSVGVFRTTLDGRLLQVNTAHARILGYERTEEIMNMRVPIFYQNPQERSCLMDLLAREGSVREFTLHLKKKDGTPIIASLSAKAHYDSTGRMDWVDGVIEDVTERSRVESERRRATESLQAALSHLEDLEATINRSPLVVFVWRVAEGWPVDFVSRNVQRMLEYTADDFLSGRVSWPGITHPDDVPWLEKDVAENIRKGVDEFVQRYRLITKSGKTRWIEDHTRAVRNAEGAITHFQGILLDITERHAAETALQESELRFREFAEMMPQTVFEVDMEGHITFINKSALELWGYPHEEAYASSCFDIVIPEERDRMREGMRLRFEGDKTAHEYTAVRKDGTRFPILLYAVPIMRNGKPIGIRGIAIDITGRKKQEEALRESEERYRTLAEGAPDMIYLCDPEGRVLYVNQQGARQFRADPQQLVGKSQADLFAPDIAARHSASIRRVVETGELLTTAVPEHMPHGDVWIDTRLVPIKNREGRVVEVLGFSRDVTDRMHAEQAVKQSEENFRALARNALDGIAIFSAEARVVYANEAMAHITDYEHETLMCKTVDDLIRPSDKEAHYKRFNQVLAGDIPAHRFEAYMVIRDGSAIPVEVSITRTDWQGSLAVMAIVRDISERKQIEEERARYAAMLLEVQERERRDISAMLHDHLGQLLTLAQLELGSVRGAEEKSAESLQRALQRLKDALDSVRRLAVSLRPPILDDLGIESAIESLTEEFMESSGAEVTFSRKGSPLQLSKKEEICLYRVLQEALTNVIRHAQATRVGVEIINDSSGITLEVRDNGKGLDARPDGHEHGIGFILMRERIAGCGGSLELRSAEEGGTILHAHVPAEASGKE